MYVSSPKVNIYYHKLTTLSHLTVKKVETMS